MEATVTLQPTVCHPIASHPSDPAHHRVVARISPGALLKHTIARDARVAKEVGEKPRPVLVECLDLASDTANQVLTPDEGGHLTGHLLRFDPDDPEQGVFFLAAGGTRTRAERYLEVRPSKVILLAPTLPAGDYEVEVKAAFNDDGDLRSGKLEAQLAVS